MIVRDKERLIPSAKGVMMGEDLKRKFE